MWLSGLNVRVENASIFALKMEKMWHLKQMAFLIVIPKFRIGGPCQSFFWSGNAVYTV